MVAKELLNDKIKSLKFIEKIEIFKDTNNIQTFGDRYNYFIHKKYLKIKCVVNSIYEYSYDIEFFLENDIGETSRYDSSSLLKKIMEIEKSILEQDKTRVVKFGEYPSPREIYDIAMENRREYKELKKIIYNHYSINGETIPDYWR